MRRALREEPLLLADHGVVAPPLEGEAPGLVPGQELLRRVVPSVRVTSSSTKDRETGERLNAMSPGINNIRAAVRQAARRAEAVGALQPAALERWGELDPDLRASLSVCSVCLNLCLSSLARAPPAA